MGLAELFVAVLLTGISCVNSAMPLGAYARSKDGRFLALSAGNLALALLGILWTWGQLPLSPPSWATASLVSMSIVLVVALIFLVATIWPRHV